jgi:aspartate ammonia-lyase
MNANEVIANRALELMGRRRGDYDVVHPNSHINLSQSTNDVYPTAVKLALHASIASLQQALIDVATAFKAKGREFAGMLKMGRTQLQDAVPMTLGQEFAAFAHTILEDVDRLGEAQALIREINMGATAIGTRLNAPEHYPEAVRAHIARISGIPVITAPDLVEATADTGVFVQLSGVVKRSAVKLSKICNDLRLLSSGPRAGLAEINLPPMQPGSSIMPGKVNPSVPEMVNQVCYQVAGCDATIHGAADAGQLELNVMMPVIAWNALHASRILRQAMRVLHERCIEGLEADEERCRELLDRSTAVATALSPHIGYAATAEIAKEAVRTGASIRDIVRARELLPDEDLDRILSVEAMTSPGVPGDTRGRRNAAVTTDRGGDGDARGSGGKAGRPTAAAHKTVSARKPGIARAAGSGRVAAARPDHGRAANRRRQRSR